MRVRSLGALTPVALRAPSVSAPKTGTFYFAQNRNFLLCLDIGSPNPGEVAEKTLTLTGGVV
jgi:hypothetical protein